MNILETTLKTRDLGGHKTKESKKTLFNRVYRRESGEKPLNQRDINFKFQII